MNISQVLTKLKALIYSKSETDSLLGGKANSSHTHTKSQITDFPSLATVATSGRYSDLSNKPTIPTNNNQLTNGAGYITSSGSCNYANYSGYVQGNKATGSYVNSVKYGNALVTTNQSGFGTIFNAPTKNYRIGCATYPDNNDTLIFYSVTNANVSSSTNTTNKMMTWNGDTGILSATGFSGPLTGNVSGNCSGSAGSVAWSNVSGKPTIPTKTSQLTNDSGFWTGGGGTWNPNANISLPASGNGQEWSFDMHRNGTTGCYWHVWEDSLGTCLKVDADNGAVSIPKNILYLGSYKVYVG